MRGRYTMRKWSGSAQSIVQTALGGHQSVNDYIRPGGRVYEQRNFVYEALNKIDGISVMLNFFTSILGKM